jgi:hypothetical protein
MDREPGVDGHLGPHRDVEAEHLELRCALGQQASSGADGLVPGQDHGVPGVRQEMPELMDHPAAGGHPGRGDDDRGCAWLVEPHRLLGAVRRVQVGKVDQAPRKVGTQVLAHRLAAIDVQGSQGHRAVHIYGHRGYGAGCGQLAKRVEHQLGAVDRESGDEDRAAPLDGAADGLRQDLVSRGAIDRMSRVAVGGLDDDRAGGHE